MIHEMMDLVSRTDPEIASAIRAEYERQVDGLELIASENVVSEAVLCAMGSVLTNKYAEGYPAKRYYGGCQCVDIAENIAIERACKLFGAKYANVQPHSGAQANTAVYFALIKPGDTVMGMSLAHGGHLTHGSPVNISGMYYNFVPYERNPETERIDLDEFERLAKEHKPKLIVAGASAYPRVIDFEKMAAIAHSVGAYFMVDMAHIAGLVAAGEHPSPVPYADVVTTTTHKTLRGPRGGMILTNDEELAKKINKAIFPGTQGGPLMHVIAAKAVCFGEALKPEFKEYQHNVVLNARTLANELLNEGFTVTNSSWMPLYIVDPKGYHGQFVKGGRWYPKDILCDWDIYTWKNWWDKSYAYEKPIVVEPTDKVIGATLCSWSWGYDIDYPGIKENLPAMCEKIWNVNSTYTIEDFEPALSKLTALADALAPKL